MPLGAHMSTSGGVEKAILRGQSVGCESIQIFTTNPSQWKSRTLEEKVIAKFREARIETGIEPIVAHARYLINLASPDDALWRRSIGAFRDELELCEQLQIPYIVIHPGAHMKSGEQVGLARVARALDELRKRTAGFQVQILLEITAGQGTTLAYKFEHLAQIMDTAHDPSWLGVCFDTCHAFGAGYELRTPQGYAETWRQFDEIMGMSSLGCMHLNDSKGCLGCRRDRHEHIGKGQLGLEPFRYIMNDPALRDLPLLLETPKGPEMKNDEKNLRVLRSLIESEGEDR